MSPLLFALYMNSLATILHEDKGGMQVGEKIISSLFFADDIILISRNKKENIERQLNIMAEWCIKWGMGISVDKTKICSLSAENRWTYMDEEEMVTLEDWNK